MDDFRSFRDFCSPPRSSSLLHSQQVSSSFPLSPSFLLRPRCNRDRTNRREGPAADPGRSAAPVPWGGGARRSGARNSLFLSSRSLFLACCLHSFLPPPSEQLSLPLPLLVLGARSVGGGDGVASTLSRAGIRNFF